MGLVEISKFVSYLLVVFVLGRMIRGPDQLSAVMVFYERKKTKYLAI